MLTSTGQLALTLYVGHVIVGLGILHAIGRLENQSLTWALYTSTLFSIGAMLFATLWRRRFRRGPIEALMRLVTN